MKATIQLGNQQYATNLSSPCDISIALQHGPNHASAWYVDPVNIEPVRSTLFTGSVAEGGSVNFRNIYFNPHGHGTHTECLGHISPEVHSVNQAIQRFFFPAILVSVEPEPLFKDDRWMMSGDLCIKSHSLEKALAVPGVEALIIRTLPNGPDKRNRNWSNTNPPYIHPEAMEHIAQSNISHLLLDLPSVDREADQGLLTAHRLFWKYPQSPRYDRTITELIFVPDTITDGLWLLELQVAPFENDASPSRPLLYPLSETL
jgi:kynurenine formamidase